MICYTSIMKMLWTYYFPFLFEYLLWIGLQVHCHWESILNLIPQCSSHSCHDIWQKDLYEFNKITNIVVVMKWNFKIIHHQTRKIERKDLLTSMFKGQYESFMNQNLGFQEWKSRPKILHWLVILKLWKNDIKKTSELKWGL